MVSQEENVKIVRAVLEEESQRSIAPAFKQRCSKFSDSYAAVEMRLAETFMKIT